IPSEGSRLGRRRYGDSGEINLGNRPHAHSAQHAIAVLSSSLSNAEAAEDQVQDVVGGRRAGDFVEGLQSGVEIQQDHLVGDAVVGGSCRSLQGGYSILHQLLMPGVGEKSRLAACARFTGNVMQNSIAEFWNALASDRGRSDRRLVAV